jgi:hypothetical protein
MEIVSFKKTAPKSLKEIDEYLGIRFGVVERRQMAPN